MKTIDLFLHLMLYISFTSAFGQIENKFGDLDASRTIKIQIINEEQALHHCFKAQNQYEKENYKVVIRQCNKALEISPSCGAAFRLRGYAKIMTDSVSSGCTDLRRAAQLGGSSMWGEVASKHYERYCKTEL